MKFMELINTHYNSFSETEKSICDFLINTDMDVSNCTINDFARKSLSSKSSVIRFCQKLGFTGYSEMKNFLKWENQEQKQKQHHYSFFSQLITDTEETINYLKDNDFDYIYELIINSQNLYVISTGVTQHLQASELQRLFMMSEKDVRIIPGTIKSAEFKRMYETLSTNDMVFIISLSGDNSDLEESIKLIQQKKIMTVSISNFQSNFLSKNCNHNIYAWSSRSPIPNDWWMRTTSTFFMIIEALVFGYNDYLNKKMKEE